MTEHKKHRQHENVSMNERGYLRIGGLVLPYYPAYYWGGMDSGTTNASTITTEGGNHAGDAGTGDSGAGANN